MKTIEIQLVEVTPAIKTRTGLATLYKGWSESEKTSRASQMKVAAPTPFQAALLGRALEATRYTEQRKSLWRAVFQQAAQTVRHYHLTWTAEELVGYWLDIQPEAEEGNRIALDDLQCGFKTIAQESGAVVVPIDSLEVTERSHLPRWCDGTSNPPEDDHLEPAFLGFEGFQLSAHR